MSIPASQEPLAVADSGGARKHAVRELDFSAPRRITIGLAVGIGILTLSAFIAVFYQRALEFPLITGLNAYAGRSALLDRSVHALTTRDLLQGAVFISLCWYLWFAETGIGTRARLLMGVVGAAFSGIISRVLQLDLPTHLRPLHTEALGFTLPIGVEPDALNHFNSFPSDHGAVFFGLALAIYAIRPRLGVAAFVWAAIVDIARIYEGYHFPSDLLGSIGLSVMILAVFRNPWFEHLARQVVAMEETARPRFYMVAFLLSYQISTLFDDIREIGRGFAGVLLHHDLFGG